MKAGEQTLRPGGTISGPAMFTLADVAVYMAIVSEFGAGPLQAVTTRLAMNFLHRPLPVDMVARVRLLKLGRRLAVGEVELYSAGHHNMVAHATATYALPSDSKR